jgi:hypothetical protein
MFVTDDLQIISCTQFGDVFMIYLYKLYIPSSKDQLIINVKP